jgi:cholesterol transport system auxiliary component
MSRYFLNLSRMFFLLAMAAIVGACAPIGPRGPEPVQYDLGVWTPASVTATPPSAQQDVIVIPEIDARGVIDGQRIVYRFAQAQSYEPRVYNESRWAQPPAEMLRIRLQQQLGLHYPVVLYGEWSGKEGWILLLTLEDFSQHFTSEQHSAGVVQLRATLLRNGEVLEQKLFHVEQVAGSANAAGAVQALAQASDIVVQQVSQWVEGRIRK